jgi:hypothetical protein
VLSKKVVWGEKTERERERERERARPMKKREIRKNERQKNTD